ncbi:MAG: hypothetical protein JWO52_6424 [Gammaproteobacteria bacterium]|nr:hypothetical protein [Gammaproteobacteria bacterium]
MSEGVNPIPAANAPPRVSELDALRGFAAVYVMLYHYMYRLDALYGHPGAPVTVATTGLAGVEVFFAISGFVIAMSLERTSRPMDFAVSRAIRLYPAYWVAVFATFAVTSFAGLPGRTVTPGEAMLNLSMLQGFLHIPSVDGAYWSLKVELLFYFWMLLLTIAGLTRHLVSLLVAWLAIALMLEAGRALGIGIAPYVAEALITPWIPFFIVGILARRCLAARRFDVPALLTILLAVGVTGVVRDPLSVGVAVATAAIFALLMSGKLAWLRAGPFVLLGAVSYPLYLLHQNIGFVCIRALSEAGFGNAAAIAVTVCAVVLLAFGVTFGIERPLSRGLREIYARWKLSGPVRQDISV